MLNCSPDSVFVCFLGLPTYHSHAQKKNKKNVSLYLLCDDYVSIIADGTSVSTFLYTQKLRPEEVSVTAV